MLKLFIIGAGAFAAVQWPGKWMVLLGLMGFALTYFLLSERIPLKKSLIGWGYWWVIGAISPILLSRSAATAELFGTEEGFVWRVLLVLLTVVYVLLGVFIERLLPNGKRTMESGMYRGMKERFEKKGRSAGESGEDNWELVNFDLGVNYTAEEFRLGGKEAE